MSYFTCEIKPHIVIYLALSVYIKAGLSYLAAQILLTFAYYVGLSQSPVQPCSSPGTWY